MKSISISTVADHIKISEESIRKLTRAALPARYNLNYAICSGITNYFKAFSKE